MKAQLVREIRRFFLFFDPSLGKVSKYTWDSEKGLKYISLFVRVQAQYKFDQLIVRYEPHLPENPITKAWDLTQSRY